MTENERLERLSTVVFGNGRAGLDERVENLERYMFVNEKTGEKGLISTVTELNSYVHRLQTTLSVLNWLLALIGVGGVATGLITLARWLGG